MNRSTPKVLAVASGGGHWEQLMLLKPAFDNAEVLYVTTLPGLPERSGIKEFKYLKECNRDDLGNIASNTLSLLNIMVRFRPNVVITTGALPGLMAIMIGKYIFRSRSVWIDSIANGSELSLSGQHAKRFADLVVSQWEDVAERNQVDFKGGVF